jgi:hypothetical protein
VFEEGLCPATYLLTLPATFGSTCLKISSYPAFY